MTPSVSQSVTKSITQSITKSLTPCQSGSVLQHSSWQCSLPGRCGLWSLSPPGSKGRGQIQWTWAAVVAMSKGRQAESDHRVASSHGPSVTWTGPQPLLKNIYQLVHWAVTLCWCDLLRTCDAGDMKFCCTCLLSRHNNTTPFLSLVL